MHSDSSSFLSCNSALHSLVLCTEKSFALTFQYEVLKNEVQNCMKEMTSYLNAHFMKVNTDKTEFLLLYPPSLEKDVITQGVILDGQPIRFSNSVLNVGVWIDKHLSMDTHINTVVAHCYKLLRDIGRIKRFLSQSQIEQILHAVISHRLDYCNSLFICTSKENIVKLQKVQNYAARLISGKRKRDSVSETLKELHWLRVEERIAFKIILLIHKVINGKCSNNLSIT